MDTTGVAKARRELAGLGKAMTSMQDETNNLAKLSEVENKLAQERRKLTEAENAEDVERIQGKISELEGIRQNRLEALSANRAALRSQV